MDLTDREIRIARALLGSLSDRGAPMADAVLHAEVEIRIQSRGRPAIGLQEWTRVRLACERGGLIESSRSPLGAARWQITAAGEAALEG